MQSLSIVLCRPTAIVCSSSEVAARKTLILVPIGEMAYLLLLLRTWVQIPVPTMVALQL